MGLLDEIAAEQGTRQMGAKCSIGLALEQMDQKDRADLEKALAEDRAVINHNVIATVLRRRGIKVGEHTVGRHRRGGCVCAR